MFLFLLSHFWRAAGRFGLRLSEREFLEGDNREKSGQGVGKTKSQSLPWKIRENDCFCLPKVSKQIGFLRAPLLPLHLLGDIRETPRTAWKSQVATARCREGSLLALGSWELSRSVPLSVELPHDAWVWVFGALCFCGSSAAVA